MFKKSSKRAGRVVRYTLADGTVTTKRYPAYRAKPKPAGKTVVDLLTAWEGSPGWAKLAENTKLQYSTYSRLLLPGMGKIPVKKVERATLLDIRDAVVKTRGPGAGIAFARTTSAAFGWAVKRGWLDRSPATLLREELADGGHLPTWTEEDVTLALAMLPEYLRRPVVLALYTGQRRGDLIAMPWSAYDGAKIRLVQEKTDQTMVLPAPPELRAELDYWRKRDPDGSRILTNKFGKPWRQAPNLSKQLGDALAKIEGFPPGRNIHGLRKLAATRLAEAGCTLHEIAAITGHQSLGMLQLYTKAVDQERAAEAATRKMADRQRRK